jgi:hypothetical protein
MVRFVALCHFVWGLVLLAAGAWFGVSVLRVLPHMSTGTTGTNLFAALLVAGSVVGPLAALGLWMGVLGRMAWTRSLHARAALLWTHGVLLMAGLLACAIGIMGMEASARSSERGGGLLGPVAVLPLLVGVPLALLALCSIRAAVIIPPRSRH